MEPLTLLFSLALFILGACLGSFLCCQVRRLRLRELHKKPLGSRSVCMHCNYRLKWYDNLPIISWLALKGKCRHCHRKIGLAELLAELGTGLSFAALYLAFSQFICSRSITVFGVFPPADSTNSLCSVSPLNIIIFIMTLIFVLTLIFLAIYDGLYGELPTLCLIISIVFAVVILALKTCSFLTVYPFSPELIWHPLLSVAILGGIYLVLYLISKGHWVGDGDWLLGTAIAIVLANPWLSLITLFLANFLACLIMYPAAKSHKNHRIHFGPFLVIAFIISYTFANFLLSMI